MTIKAYCPFEIGFVGDGSTDSVTVSLTTAPFGLLAANGNALQPGFSLAALTPSGALNVSSSDGHAITASIGLLNTITFTWGIAPSAGVEISVTGQFEF